MPGIARQFEPQITRTGGTPSKYRFTVQCSACRKADTFEANKSASDDRVKGYFKERGWLLGRDQTSDLCPGCLAKPREPQHPRPSNEARRPGFQERHPDRPATPMEKRSRDTADILARHLGKPDALAAEVFRPKPAQPPRPLGSDTPQPPSSTPVLSREVEQALTGMATDLKDLRSSLELMAEQVTKLVALGSQQIEAVARLAPLVAQSADGISGGLRDIVSAIQSAPRSSFPPAQPAKTEEQPMLLPRPSVGQVQVIGSEQGSPVAVEIQEPVKQPQRRARHNNSVHKAGSAGVAVKSIPDAKRSDRFYTSIRLPRELWDKAGFGPEDRLLLNWSGKALTIERTSEGGVKPKAIGDTSVVLQSWRLGNLNFEQPKVTGANASLHLAGNNSKTV